MEKNKLDKTIREVNRFLDAVKALKHDQPDVQYGYTTSKESGAVRRASMGPDEGSG